ncbi:MAG: glycosyltransferase family 4 protein [Planctomycetota bacterium]|nr:glycosyltransferase family 4 protein [Planctomycetota bacterium]
MKIGIDGGCLANKRGFGRFARHALAALARANTSHELVVFVDRPSLAAAGVPEGVRRVVVDVAEAPSRAASSVSRRRFADLFAMSRATARERLDLLYFPASYSYFPPWNVGRVVVTMHDVLAFRHPHLVFTNGRGRLAWRLKEQAAVRRADLIMTVSESARRDLIACFRLDRDRVRAVHEAADAVFRPLERDAACDAALAAAGLAPDAKFLLYVGGLSPHKNLPRLLEAFARAAPPDWLLTLVGDLGDGFHSHVPALREHVARLHLEARVLFTGYLCDEILVHLYNRSIALAQPSLLEGFGLPAVEAMACGAPVLASRAGSLPEVVGDAGIYFNPRDVEAIARAISALRDDPALRDELARRALERARQFDWGRTGRALVEAFESCVGGRRSP